jgi:glutathione S-transferase
VRGGTIGEDDHGKDEALLLAGLALRAQSQDRCDGDQARQDDLEMVNVAVSPIAPNADVEKHNPIGKIPALSVKGMDLFDSPVMAHFRGPEVDPGD